MEEKLRKLIKEDNVEEFERILNSNKLFQNTFNTLCVTPKFYEPELPILLLAVKDKSQKIVEYLLSLDIVDKTICNIKGENIYHIICKIRGAEELFSIIERIVPQNLILNNSFLGGNAFHYACKKNNIFIVKRLYEILESFQVDLTQIKNYTMRFAIKNKDNIEVIKYILSIDGIQLNDADIFLAIKFLNIDIIVYLMNFYLCQSIPSHLHNQFHIFQFLNHPSNYIINNYNNKINLNNNLNNKINNKNLSLNNNVIYDINNLTNNLNNNLNNNNNNNEDGNNDYEYYLKLVEENYDKIINIKLNGERIWHRVCRNENLDVVQLIYSLKGIQPDLLNNNEKNVFLIACKFNSNIKVIKFLHKLFPSFIHSRIDLD